MNLASLKAKGVKAWGKVVDIADGPALKAFVTEAGEQLGGLDILVSNASALSTNSSEEAWKALFDIDIMGAVRSFDAARAQLEAAAESHGDASFTIISSVSAAEAGGGISAYGAIVGREGIDDDAVDPTASIGIGADQAQGQLLAVSFGVQGRKVCGLTPTTIALLPSTFA